MKLGFNEANDRFCKNHSVMMDLELCEKYGFDCIDIQSEFHGNCSPFLFSIRFLVRLYYTHAAMPMGENRM